ncbi:MAG: hypothetical protein P4L62_00255 [Candidatus Pacebacteria bacterium]|nr:hypothetical protein [Candidatus Paceibacterota bacterium]MDR3582781.1 hypothetical protein [Candidatus Paceibacterota bacterium]
MRSENRKSNRLVGYDYSQEGMYFVTFCTKERIEWFGEVKNGEMLLNKYGEITEQQLSWLAKQYKYINIDCKIVMPNHVHTILEILPDVEIVGTGRDLSLRFQQSKIKPLPELIGALKTTSSKLIHRNGFNDFAWQRSYWDRIIRDEAELNRIREYIFNNPQNWEQDRNNSENIFM